MAKITTLAQALEVIKKLREENAALSIKAMGKRSDGTIDKYTDMEAAELRALVIRRGGEPDEVVKGLHSRQRSIAMREWLREHTAGGKVSKPRRLSEREIEEIASPKKVRKPKAEAVPARKPKKPAKPETKSTVKAKKPRSM